MRKNREPDLAAIAESLYRARSSTTWERLLKPLTAQQREQIQKLVCERIEADKARLGLSS